MRVHPTWGPITPSPEKRRRKVVTDGVRKKYYIGGARLFRISRRRDKRIYFFLCAHVCTYVRMLLLPSRLKDSAGRNRFFSVHIKRSHESHLKAEKCLFESRKKRYNSNLTNALRRRRNRFSCRKEERRPSPPSPPF